MELDVQEWYHKLNSRVVDLVGDFAGNELFIIEGDSLLLHCFTNPKLDFNPGLQVLHATYLVEQVIYKLRQRRCVFDIVFFAENAQCCIPPMADSGSHDKYLLAREAITQHLISIQGQVSPPFQVLKFRDIRSRDFGAYLNSCGAYLFICHDGAVAATTRVAYTDTDTESDVSLSTDIDKGGLEDEGDTASFTAPHAETSKLKLRAMIHCFSDCGYNTALINSLEFLDTKVMVMMLDGSTKRTKDRMLWDNSDTDNTEQPDITDLHRRNLGRALHDMNKALSVLCLSQDTCQPLSPQKFDELLASMILDQPTLTQRQLLLIATLSAMFLSGVAQSIINKTAAQAMILHLVILQETRLSNRGIKTKRYRDSQFLNAFLISARAILASTFWANITTKNHLWCDLCDFLDGTLFLAIQEMAENDGIRQVLSSVTFPSFKTLASSVDQFCGSKLSCASLENGVDFEDVNSQSNENAKSIKSSTRAFGKVLPFSNSVFDEHLRSVHLVIDESSESRDIKGTSKVFLDETHWHNSKSLKETEKVTLSPEQSKRFRRKQQFFMADMERYAASLTGSAGSASRENIVVEPFYGSNDRSKLKPTSKDHLPDGKSTRGSKRKEQVAASIREKAADETQKQRQRWKRMYQEEFTRISGLGLRFKKLKLYLSSLSAGSKEILEAEILGCMIDTLVRLAFFERESMGNDKLIFIATRIWELINRLPNLRKGVSAAIATFVNEACQLIGLPTCQLDHQSDESLSFQPFNPPTGLQMSIGIPSAEFQLSYGGHCMERSIESMPDPRTPDFDPDRWQREVLDQIDQKNSLFIVAPTSAGKTFISFYAMRQILKADDDGILVYVAPTKALVNQIAAEVLARFSKSYQSRANGKSVWAIHTRDYRINEPKGCQILITVPHILQIMLLAPTNANAWTPRIRRIIFDEIHCIGQAEDGVTSILGSAKIRIPSPEIFSFKGFSSHDGLPLLGLDEATGMKFIHPVISLIDRSKPIPDGLDLEPRDCLTLWKAMSDLQTERFPVDNSLDPSVFFSSGIIKKAHTIEWQKQLKSLLTEWMRDQGSPFQRVLLRLENRAPGYITEEEQSPSDPTVQAADRDVGLLDSTLPLVYSLHSQDALPALFFNYDRSNDDYEGPGSREDQMRDSASTESTQFDRFDPERPLNQFSLADSKKIGPGEFSTLARELKARQVAQFLIDALERGIGVHHSGLNRKYRHVCEMLFRKGFLRIVFATGTLALGINMPCKTVVFSGDSIFLTALNFRQAAGRAGRRGFDLLGNVVFQRVPRSKMLRLISSKLPDLNGHFPITTSLVLRLFILLQGSNQAASAIKSINSLLSSPRIYLGGSQMKETVLHHLRFSIEYLRRNRLIDRKGVPLNFAGCVSHLSYTESSSFAFHALLSSGYIQSLCKSIKSRPKMTVTNLMLVMAHIFKRLPLRAATLEWYQTVGKRPSSVVVLPPLPKKAVESLRAHNKNVLQVYSAGVWLEESVIPYLAISSEESPAPLNAYLYDFFKHGNVSQLETANRIRRGDIWFLLNDFSLVLSTINTSLDAFLAPGGNISADMTEVVGGGDAHESHLEMHIVDSQIDTEDQETHKQEKGSHIREDIKHSTSRQVKPNIGPKKLPDSWEDEAEEEVQDFKDVEEFEQVHSQHPGSGLKNQPKEPQPEAKKEEPVDKSERSVLSFAGLQRAPARV
ncbi:hypothetical protein N7541_009969 [Penicillium brevicompactum]|uniref:Uncharacterized protein n=1 Tax=Penicillium brevicompactum TaxID=5074 RepID=A0A9W9QMX0_PENBR|nr:hypothetical protein N7541_009969 [Penicillium brevicompactum]